MKQLKSSIEESSKKIITIPNMLSFFRICLVPLIVWLFCIEHNFRLTGYILLLSGATDMVDGYVARRFHMISDLGKVLDPIADKLTQASMLICLLFRFPMMICPLALLIAKEIFMAVTGICIIRKTGIVLGASWHGKAATCLLYGMMIVHVFWYEISYFASVCSILVCTLMIGVSFVLYGIRNIKALRADLNSNL